MTHDWKNEALDNRGAAMILLVLGMAARTSTWSVAPQLYQYLTLETNSYDVGPADAIPGDLLFWQPANGSLAQIHHVAILTAVVLGDLLYTQHSGAYVNKSLAENEMRFDHSPAGPQVIHILRIVPKGE